MLTKQVYLQFRGLDGNIGGELGKHDHTVGHSCKVNCADIYEMCVPMTLTIDEQMMCIEARIICRMKCSLARTKMLQKKFKKILKTS